MEDLLSSPLTVEGLAVIAFIYATSGMLLVKAVYTGLESSPLRGGLYGVVYTAAVVLSSRMIGSEFLSLTWSDFEAAVITAVLAATAGACLIVLGWEPELEGIESDPNKRGLDEHEDA